MFGLRRDNFISGPQGISLSGFSVKKIIKEIFFKISEKLFYYFSSIENLKTFFEKIWATLEVFVKAEIKKNNTKKLEVVIASLSIKIEIYEIF